MQGDCQEPCNTYHSTAKIRTTELISHKECAWTMIIQNSVLPILHFCLRENRIWSSRNFRQKYREVSPLSSGGPQHAPNLQMHQEATVPAILFIMCTLQLTDIICRIIIELLPIFHINRTTKRSILLISLPSMRQEKYLQLLSTANTPEGNVDTFYRGLTYHTL